jgi:hypothetical protein
MEKLYDEFGKFTEDGTNLILESEKVLFPIFEKYMNKEYHIREIAHLIGFSLNTVESTNALKLMYKKSLLKRRLNENPQQG